MGCTSSSAAGGDARAINASPVAALAQGPGNKRMSEQRKRSPTEDALAPMADRGRHHKKGSKTISHAAVAKARDSMSEALRRVSSMSMMSPNFLKKYAEDGSVEDIVVPFLSQFVMFRHLKKKELLKAARCFGVQKFEPNQSIIVKGERGDSLYIIGKSGSRLPSLL
jgi:hypothetical protein